MSNYTKSTNFATKDSLSSGDPLKIVKGTEINTEFDNIATAISTKYDSSFTIPVTSGGTGATTASAARTNLGLVIGTDVQAYDADLTTWAGKTAPSGTVVGTSDTQTLTNKTLTSPTLTTPNIDSAQFATVSGTAPIYPCRAWVNFNGTGTVAIRASGNVSSITDNGTGDYTVNFTTAMSDANYSVTATAQFDTASATSSDLFAGAQPVRRSTAFATTGIRVGTCRPSDGVNLDFTVVSIAVFR